LKVYPIGYSALGAKQWLDKLTSDPEVLVMDTRLKPWSQRPEYRKEELEQKYGDRYHWCGRFLGNEGYKSNYIKIVNPDIGIRGLVKYLNEGHDLVLLCQCASYLDCHRKVVVDLLQQKIDVDVVQPPRCHVEPGMIKTISVRQPYATWLSNPGPFINAQLQPKNIENRDWSTDYRGRILIHASKTFEKDALPFWLSRCPELREAVPLDEAQYPRGMLVGDAELVKVITQADPEAKSPWFCGPYGFMLASAKPIDSPVPCRGALKLFNVDASVLQR